MLILALDQSTSATKALLFDAEGRVLEREAREHRQHYPEPGWVEHDADEIWSNTLDVLGTVVRRAGEGAARIAALSITNQRETIVLFERGSGRPVHPAIVWQDRRGDALCAAQAAAGREAALHRKTGLKLDAYFSASKLQWLLRERADLRERVERGEVLVGTIDAYLVYRLSAGKVFATDHTNASRTLLFDIVRLDWDDELCAWWDVPRRALPEVRESTARFGETTLDGTLAAPLPICGVMGDSQASLFAQRCFAPGSVKATFGTGSSLMLNVGAYPKFSDKGVVTALAWVHGGVPTYAFEGIVIAAASTLAWLRDQLGVFSGAAEIEALAASVPDSGGVAIVPAFSGLGLPYWNASARGAIVGLSAHSDRRHLARAAIESIALQVRDALEAMRAEAGLELSVLQADGGPTANRLLMQLTADLTGVEVRAAEAPDCSPLGAAMAGMLGMGVHASLDALAALPHGAAAYEPRMDPEPIAALLRTWRDAVARVVAEPERP
jgi:glycerol kinase